MHARSTTVLAAAVLLLTAFSAAGQHSFERTRTVDPSGRADETSIADALTFIGDDPDDKWTILVYAGVYDENVDLGATKKNIDIVGVDRDAVIIRPSADGPGIKITSGTETERNNRIANLTIDTTTSTNGGHGVEIVKGGGVGATTPTNIIIDGVTIRTTGTDNHGIEGSAAEDVRINDCDIDAGDAMGVRPGSRFEIVNSIVQNQSLRMDIGAVHIDGGRTNITIDNCVIRGGRAGIFAGEPASDNPSAIRIIGVTIETNGADSDAIHFDSTASGIEIRDVTITTTDGHGIELSDGLSVTPSDLTLNGVTINAAGTGYRAINGSNASDVTLFNCILESDERDGVEVGMGFRITNSILNAIYIVDRIDTIPDAPAQNSAGRSSQDLLFLLLPQLLFRPFVL